MKPGKAREYHSKTIQRLEEQMKNDPWYIKLRRWWNVTLWVWGCRTRFIWDLNYQHNIFKKKK
jgi:hypothetical protein